MVSDRSENDAVGRSGGPARSGTVRRGPGRRSAVDLMLRADGGGRVTRACGACGRRSSSSITLSPLGFVSRRSPFGAQRFRIICHVDSAPASPSPASPCTPFATGWAGSCSRSPPWLQSNAPLLLLLPAMNCMANPQSVQSWHSCT